MVIDQHAVLMHAQAQLQQPQQMTDEQRKELQDKYDAEQAEREQLAADRFLAIFKKLREEVGENMEGAAIDVAGLIVFGAYAWRNKG